MAFNPGVAIYFFVVLFLVSSIIAFTVVAAEELSEIPPSPSPQHSSSDSPSPSPAHPPSVKSAPASSPLGSSPPAPTPDNSHSDSAPTPSPSPTSSPSPVEADADGVRHSTGVKDGDGKSSSGMSSGKKAGIAVGVIAAAGVGVVGCLVYRKRRQNIERSQYGYAARRELL